MSGLAGRRAACIVAAVILLSARESALAQCAGARYVAPSGNDAGNACADPGAPCRTINHAIASACVTETVNVAEGTYNEDVTIAFPMTLRGTGVLTRTKIVGSGATDVVRILASDVTLAGLNISGAPQFAALRIGSSLVPNVRRVVVENAALTGCGYGLVVDSTGVPPGPAQEIRIAGVEIFRNVAGALPDSGAGVLLTNGNGSFRMLGGSLNANEGPGLLVQAPPPGRENRLLLVVGVRVTDNGEGPAASGRSGIEVRGASDVRIEGNLVRGQRGTQPGDGVGVVLEDVAGGFVHCNRFEDNGTGFELRGATGGFAAEGNAFTGNGTGLRVGPAAGAGTAFSETVFAANDTGVANEGVVTLALRHNWWGAADGPSGPGLPGTGDVIDGPADASLFVPRALRPILARRPVATGWTPATASCFDRLADAIAAAPDNGLVLAGPGRFAEGLTLARRVDIEGIDGGSACSPTLIDGTQAGGSHRPALRVGGVAGVTLRHLDIRNAGRGTPCGQNTGDEFGLDLRDAPGTVVEDVCVGASGTAEIRVYGESDDVRLTRVSLFGRTTFPLTGGGSCTLVSPRGLYVDGGPVCEGGTGASVDRATITDLAASGSLRTVEARHATALTLRAASLAPDAAGAGVVLGPSDGAALDDLDVGLAHTAVLLRGRQGSECDGGRSDVTGAALTGSRLHDASLAGVHLARAAGDPGRVLGAVVSCSEIRRNATGVLVEDAGTAGAPNRARDNTLAGNTTAGVQNVALETFDARFNDWGDPSGPSGGGPGLGDAALGPVDVAGFRAASPVADGDGDGVPVCAGDCDDARPDVHPGAVELCDGADNDCDGTVDDGAGAGGATTLTLAEEAMGTRVTWTAFTGATYDLVRGRVSLLAPAGDFASATEACDEDDTSATSYLLQTSPGPGDAFFLLVRVNGCGGTGSYDDGGPGLAASRDPGLAASANACP